MTSNLLATELNNLSVEAKRKNTELRNAADKSLQELKALPVTSEQQLAADLSRRSSFIEPFLLACNTRNAKFAGSGVACLQRLIIAKGLPTSRLQDALDALNACTDLGLEIQLKVLQALPSLLQNYADDLKGDLLSGALQVCSSLQSAKVQTVSGVASATLQQLVTAVFEKVADEDKRASNIAATHEVPGADEPIHLRPAAYDAYRVFRDFVLAAESRKTKFVQFTSLTRESSLELIWSCINAHPELIGSHPELGSIIQANVLPLVTQPLSEKSTFPVTVRSLRILDMILSRYLKQFPAECEVALGLVTNTLDSDSAPLWKRAMVLELLRSFLVDGNHVIDAYSMFDMADEGKPIVQDIMATFVRMSTEKPTVIGLGQQSTVPVGPITTREQAAQDISMEAAGSMAGVISTALGVTEVNVAGVSAQWSLPRSPCLEQFDKADPPTIPETYVYALVLECLNGFADCLAKAVLPLTVHQDRLSTQVPDSQSMRSDGPTSDTRPTSRRRSQSLHRRTVSLDPRDISDAAIASRVKVVTSLVESCWPAVLATASTFLNAALDDQYHRNLIKAYQRFAQVAGLLRLGTARDALMTTLGKAAVPPHVLNNLMVETPKTPVPESPRVFSNPKSLLSVDSLVSQASIDRDRRAFAEGLKPTLTTRNLLCLRALLNLAIALGPTMQTAFGVVVDTLRQADIVLSSTTPQQMVRQGLTAAQRQTESPSVVQAFSNEVAAVEAAATRLLESTSDYPNEAFVNVLNTFCAFLHRPNVTHSPVQTPDAKSPSTSPPPRMRSFSGLSSLNINTEMQMKDYKFAVPKLGRLASLNVSRFASDEPAESGWNVLIEELVNLASNNTTPKDARRAATDVLCKVAAETVAEVMDEEAAIRAVVQRRALAVLLRTVDSIYAEDGELTAGDIDVQGYVVDSLRAIVERCGESLVAGWNRTLAILSSVFERSGTPPERPDQEQALIDWDHISKDLVSVALGRTAFAATQLICSDFLSAVPTSVMPALIELLYRFASQNEDLNISLTTITMAWNVSDFLLNSIPSDELHEMAKRARESDDIVAEVESSVRTSTSAQWLLVLFRIQDVIRTGHTEVRKAAFQTLCSIFKNHGEQFSSSTWDLTLRSIVFKVAANDAISYLGDDGDAGSKQADKDESISSAIISGMSEIIAQHLRQVEQVTPLPSLWEAFLSRLEAYLDIQHHALNSAVYQALSRVVARIGSGSKVWSGPMYRTLHLWLKRNPADADVQGSESNQDAFSAYVEAGAELYRLTQQSMSVPQTRTLVENLYLIIRHSDGPRYGADISTLSQVQGKVLSLFKSIKSDSPSTLIVVAAKLVTLHHDTSSDAPSNARPTFVAISSEAIHWLQILVLDHISEEDLVDSGSFINAVQSLRQLVVQKYKFDGGQKGTPLWQKATQSALALSKPLLDLSAKSNVDTATTNLIFAEYAMIAGGIIGVEGLDSIDLSARVYEDEQADIESFKQLREALIPRFGSRELDGNVRAVYTRALFDASVIHPLESTESSRLTTSPLKELTNIRRGRVRKVSCAVREEMSYICLSELVALTSKSDGSPERRMLAQAVAPMLVLRLAIPIRAYIADQPLRGRSPQPLSELDELLKVFEIIKDLRCEPDCLSLERENAHWTGEQAHLHYLYPLLVQAMATAGDRRSGSEEVLKPLQEVFRATSNF